MQFISIVRFL